ncbi:hypothetical protein [Priestia koreensis]|nr:hypothetical protein [Priestia koreensis]
MSRSRVVKRIAKAVLPILAKEAFSYAKRRRKAKKVQQKTTV